MGLLSFFLNRKPKEKERFILSIDGGGMRGVVAATVLNNIDNLIKSLGATKPLYTYFDLISGTSTGGIIALGLSTPPLKESILYDQGDYVPTSKIVDIYKNYGSIIFPRSQRLFSLNTIGQLFSEKYDETPFNQLLVDLFGQLKMNQLKRPTMVVTYDLTNDRPYVISSYANPNTLVKKAARATSAAPTYFSPTFINDEQSGKRVELIDGGVIANNPVLYTYKEAKKLYPDATKFNILSISTASTTFKVELSRVTGSGVIGWLDPAKGVPIYRLYGATQMITADEIASTISDINYLRIHNPLEKSIRLDDTDPISISEMIKQGDKTYLEHEQKLRDFSSSLIKNNFVPTER